ncbi:MAG: CHRD domain-containing protein [Steroidobacterales bacterium]|jgi:hypothetical protein
MRTNAIRGRFSFITRCVAAGALAALALSACGGGYGGGGGSGGSNPCGGVYTPCPKPTVGLTAPAANATVSGTVALTATAAAATMNGLSVARVDFMVDGTNVGTAMTSPYTVNWDSTKVADGSHAVTAKVTDSVNGTATTPATTVTVKNTAAAAVAMAPSQVFPAPQSGASGMANITVKLETGATRGTVQLRGVTATAVSINEGFAGSSGAAVIRLTPAAGAWEVPAGAMLSPEQVTALMQGKLYVLASSAANPRGEVRGQIAPGNVIVRFTDLAATAEAASLGIAASGVAATTVDTSANTLTVHVNSIGVDDALAAQVNTGAKVAELVRDSVSMGHWSTEPMAISAAEVANFQAGRWQVRVATPVALTGAIGGQISGAQAH